jgi:hypothetical protein
MSLNGGTEHQPLLEERQRLVFDEQSLVSRRERRSQSRAAPQPIWIGAQGKASGWSAFNNLSKVSQLTGQHPP